MKHDLYFLAWLINCGEMKMREKQGESEEVIFFEERKCNFIFWNFDKIDLKKSGDLMMKKKWQP